MCDDDLKQKVDEIHKALVGDQYREESYLKKVDRHDKKLVQHDSYFYMFAGAYFLLVFLFAYGDKILSLFR